jgi:hypothetical protein
MIGTFLSQFGAGLGKGFVMSGLLPAAVFLLGLRWYRYGSEGIAASVQDILRSDAVTLSALALAALGLLFYASRGFFLYVLQTVPGAPLQGLRDHLVASEVRRGRRLRAEKERFLARLTALNWATERDFALPGAPAPGVAEEFRAYHALLGSREGRAVLARLARTEERDAVLAFDERVRAIVEGLLDLHRLAALAPGDPALPRELDAWRKVLADPDHGARELLVEVWRVTNARYLEVYAAYQALPREERARPTRLGNRLAALEAYARRRYQIDTSALWVRIWGVLSADERGQVVDAQLRVEALASFCVSLFALALTIAAAWAIGERPEPGTPVVAVGTYLLPRALWTALLAGGSLLLAGMSYRAAEFAFGTLAETITRLVDLHRTKLLLALGYEPPKTVAEELEIWAELRAFFAQAKARTPTRALRTPPLPKDKDG